MVLVEDIAETMPKPRLMGDQVDEFEWSIDQKAGRNPQYLPLKGDLCRTSARLIPEQKTRFWLIAKEKEGAWDVRMMVSQERSDNTFSITGRKQDESMIGLSLQEAMRRLHKFEHGQKYGPLQKVDPTQSAKGYTHYLDFLEDNLMTINEHGATARYQLGGKIDMPVEQKFDDQALSNILEAGRQIEAEIAAKKAEIQLTSLSINLPDIPQPDESLFDLARPYAGKVNSESQSDGKYYLNERGAATDKLYQGSLRGGFDSNISSRINRSLNEPDHKELAALNNEVQLARLPVLASICEKDSPMNLARLISHIGTLDQNWNSHYLTKTDSRDDGPIVLKTMIGQNAIKTLLFALQYEPQVFVDEITKHPKQVAALFSHVMSQGRNDTISILMAADKQSPFNGKLVDALLFQAVELGDRPLFDFALANGAKTHQTYSVERGGKTYNHTLFFRTLELGHEDFATRLHMLGEQSWGGAAVSISLQALFAAGQDELTSKFCLAPNGASSPSKYSNKMHDEVRVIAQYDAVHTLEALIGDKKIHDACAEIVKTDIFRENIIETAQRHHSSRVLSVLSRFGKTPAETPDVRHMIAAANSQSAADFTLLLEQGGDIDAVDDRGISARQVIELRGRKDLAQAYEQFSGKALETQQPQRRISSSRPALL